MGKNKRGHRLMKTLALKKAVESKYQIQAQSDCLKCKGYGCRCGGRCKQCIDHEAGLHGH